MARGHDLDPDLDFGSHIHIQTTGNGETQAVPTGLGAWPGGFPTDSIHFCNCFAPENAGGTAVELFARANCNQKWE